MTGDPMEKLEKGKRGRMYFNLKNSLLYASTSHRYRRYGLSVS